MTKTMNTSTRWIVEGRGERGDWSREYVEADGDAVCATRADADAAVDSLVDTLGWKRADLRVREIQ